MPQCSVLSCSNKGGKNSSKNENISYHVFPRNPELRQQWIDATGQGPDWKPASVSNTICSQHFEEKCFQRFKKTRKLFVWALPTLKLGNTAESPAEMTPDKTCQHILVPKDVCSKCNQEFKRRDSDLYLGGRAKAIIAHVYYFFEVEFKDIKNRYGDTIDYSPFAKLRKRTSEATGVCLDTIRRILKEENEWNEKKKRKKRKMCKTGLKTGSPHDIVEDSDESNNKCKKNCDSDCENEFEKSKDRGRKQAENNTENTMVQNNTDVNENKIVNVDELQTDRMETEDSELQNETNSEVPVTNDSPSIEAGPKTTTETQNCRKEDEAVPLVLNVVITQEEYYKTHKNNLETDENVVALDTEDVEFEFHEIDPALNTNEKPQPIVTTELHYCSAETAEKTSTQSTETEMETRPLVTTEPQYYSLESINPMMNQLNGALVSSKTQYCSLETVNPMINQSSGTHIETQPLYTTEPQYCSLETINPSTTQPVVHERQFYSLEQINPLMSQLNGTLVPTEPQFCSLEPNNPMLTQPASTQTSTQPLVLTKQIYCGMDPAMNTSTILRQPSLVRVETQAQPLMTSEGQYISTTTDGQTMATLPRADFTNGLNYYVIM